MRKTRSPSKATQLTLKALFNSAHAMHGYEIMKSAGIRPGTLYPMLARLEDQGLLTSEWEKVGVEGRPPRHIYRLTEAGWTFTANLVDDQQSLASQKLGQSSI